MAGTFMVTDLTHFFTYNKIYLFTGVILFLLVIVPTKEKISSKTKKFLYVFIVLWIICFAYRINTGNDITGLFNSSNAFENENESKQIKGSPFKKYYSNDAGRESKTGNQ